MSLKFTILGCGSSLGIPRIDGYYGKCDANNKKNVRSRSVSYPHLTLQTTPYV